MPEQKLEDSSIEILERRLTTTSVGGAVLLDAIASERDGGRFVRMMFRAMPDFPGIKVRAAHDLPVVHNFGGAAVVDMALESDAETVPFSIGGESAEAALSFDETELFADLNAICAVRNGEPVEVALEWLKYHAETQGMQAAVIVDRARPEDSAAFAAELRRAAMPIEGLHRVVVLSADIPLGKPDLPDEAHPFNVPSAPGKDRMEVPDPDPWRAPLGEFLIYELARARFLARARAVANIDLFDLIMPKDGGSVFDRAVASTRGGIRLEGHQAYPWRLRPDTSATFADHICVQFDSRSVRLRWCVAPARLTEPTIWRLIRVVGLVPEVDEAMHFFRFMALRHPTDSVSKIVPKTSLIENDELLELSMGHFGWKPVRVPEEEIVHHSDKARRTTIVTTMKNEGPFILEWLAYHRVIGVDNFLIYTNDCTDGTDTMLQMLDGKGLVHHRDNPFKGTGLKPQHAALQAADKEPIVRESDWLVCMDVDEFINIKCGKGRLDDLFDAVGDANMISMTWRLFGNNEVRDYNDNLIIEDFTRCAHEITRKPHQAWGFKTLFRNKGIFKKLGVHRPNGLKPQLWESINWVNGSGKPMPPSVYRNAWRSSLSTVGYDLVQLNHYAVRSAESFLVKRDRGRVNHVDRDQGLSYWFRMNNNAEEERSIQRMIPAVREEMARLLKDPDIAEAHAYSVRKHREKIDELKKRDDFLELFEALAGRRLNRLSRMHAHFGANVFLAGPDVIPDEIVEKEPGDKFWFTVHRTETTH